MLVQPELPPGFVADCALVPTLLLPFVGDVAFVCTKVCVENEFKTSIAFSASSLSTKMWS
jgi:hypothetical protein